MSIQNGATASHQSELGTLENSRLYGLWQRDPLPQLSWPWRAGKAGAGLREALKKLLVEAELEEAMLKDHVAPSGAPCGATKSFWTRTGPGTSAQGRRGPAAFRLVGSRGGASRLVMR